MNFDDENGPQRPISGSDSLDQKIVASPSSYALGSNERKTRDGTAADGTIETLQDADVLCGRGKTSFNHAGNKRFRDLITSSIPEYDKAESRLEKSLVVHSIVEGIRSVGGRFLKADEASGRWRELDDRACREKVGHAIRDAATISQARRQRRKQRWANVSASRSFLPSRGPISRYAEMKLDTPDPVSFHDIVHFSNMMSGPPSFAALGSRQPVANVNIGQHTRFGAVHSSFLPAAQQEQNQSNTESSNQAGNAHRTDQEHQPSDEDGFMAQIDQVLGPMPPNHNVDPLAELLDLP